MPLAAISVEEMRCGTAASSAAPRPLARIKAFQSTRHRGGMACESGLAAARRSLIVMDVRGVASAVSSHLRVLPLAVHLLTGRRGAGLPGPGPPLPLLLLHLPVLPAEQKRGAAQRRLLLHGLVRHHRHPRLQVGIHSVPRYKKKGGIKVEKR